MTSWYSKTAATRNVNDDELTGSRDTKQGLVIGGNAAEQWEDDFPGTEMITPRINYGVSYQD